ncbi:MAG: hypothetical protein GF401_13400 [Chitinivibrionales bacterium]|nr:hypothetical protein [Chitinivibrionales bacterium]
MATFIAAAVLALVHLFGAKLTTLERIPRSRWLSFAGGISVAYAFMHLLPDLAKHHKILKQPPVFLPDFIHYNAYFIALLGLVTFYGLERHIRTHRRKRGPNEPPAQGAFWLHIGSFSLYNGLMGYLLLTRTGDELLFYSIAIGLHFLVNDNSLRQDHKHLYATRGRWFLAASIILGWSIGLLSEIHELVISTLTAFVAGSIVLNVLKEELPEERESHFLSFFIGAVVYSLILLAA